MKKKKTWGIEKNYWQKVLGWKPQVVMDDRNKDNFKELWSLNSINVTKELLSFPNCIWNIAFFSAFLFRSWKGLKGDSPIRCIHILLPRTYECYLIWRKSLCICNSVREIEIKRLLGWFDYPGLFVGSKSNEECPSNSETKEYLISIRWGNIVTTESENGVRQLQGKEWYNH